MYKVTYTGNKTDCLSFEAKFMSNVIGIESGITSGYNPITPRRRLIKFSNIVLDDCILNAHNTGNTIQEYVPSANINPIKEIMAHASGSIS